jgi:hypothetical protein
MLGKIGTEIGWFGIIRGIQEEPEHHRTLLIVEMKYSDGLTDGHIQTVSFYGGGDFYTYLSGTGHAIGHLSLIRVYGTVRSEFEGRPVVEAVYVRHWDWGLFNFMPYGTQQGNDRWLKLCRVPMEDVYAPRTPATYYEERLGRRGEAVLPPGDKEE